MYRKFTKEERLAFLYLNSEAEKIMVKKGLTTDDIYLEEMIAMLEKKFGILFKAKFPGLVIGDVIDKGVAEGIKKLRASKASTTKLS